MKKWFLISVVTLIAGCKSCGIHNKKQDINFEGSWSGSVTDRTDVVNVMLTLYNNDDNTMNGKFEVLNPPGMDEPLVFEIAKIEIYADRITFVIPVSGEIDDDDALDVELWLHGDRLEGNLQEKREGSEEIPFILTR